MPRPEKKTGQKLERLCVACRHYKPRGELIWLTLEHESASLRLNNERSRIFGRSAYICRTLECLSNVQNQKCSRLKGALLGRKKTRPSLDHQKLSAELVNVIGDICTEFKENMPK